MKLKSLPTTITPAEAIALAKQIQASAPPQAKATLRQTDSTVVVDTAKGKVFSAVWDNGRAHAMAAEGLVSPVIR